MNHLQSALSAFACLLMSAATIHAQSVTTLPLNSSSLCPGGTITVGYQITGSFVTGNAYIAQLSDASGSFETALANIGSVTATTSGTIQATIPTSLAPGTGYRIRVMASNPGTIGSDNGSNLVVYAKPEALFDRADRNVLIIGAPTTFVNNSKNAVTFAWDFGEGANPRTSTQQNPGPVSYSTPGTKQVRLTVKSIGGCIAVSDTHRYESKIEIYPINPTIPSDAAIVQGTYFPPKNGENGIRWICPGGSYKTQYDHGSNRIVVVETGGNVSLTGGGSIIYLRRGASVIGTGLNTEFSHTIIYEPGAGLSNLDDSTSTYPGKPLLYPVDSIRFDYTNAPSGGCPSLAPYRVKLKDDIEIVRTAISTPGSGKNFLVENGGVLTINGDGNTICIEPGGKVIASGNVNRIYLKNGASFESIEGNANRIFYELDALIINPGTKADLFPSNGITYELLGTSVVPAAKAELLQELKVMPNPVRDQVSIAYTQQNSGIVHVSIFNIRGECVISYDSDVQTPGEHILSLPVQPLIEGSYTVVVSEKDNLSVGSINIVR